MMDREDMFDYIGSKRNQKVSELLKEIRAKSEALVKSMDAAFVVVDSIPENAKLTEAEHQEFDALMDDVMLRIGEVGLSVDILRVGDSFMAQMLELVEQEIVSKEFLKARKTSDWRAKRFCPTAHGDGDNCDFN